MMPHATHAFIEKYHQASWRCSLQPNDFASQALEVLAHEHEGMCSVHGHFDVMHRLKVCI